MKTHSRKRLTLLLLISILLTYAVIPSAGAFGTQDPIVQPRQAEAISVLAEYMTGGGDSAGALLARHDYPPPVDAPTWRQYSAVKKITTAYVAAQTANPAQGGERLLALLSQAMARKYDSAKVDPALKPYLDIKFDPYVTLQSNFLTFRNPTSPSAAPSLPDNVVAAIDTISEYTSKGPVGSPQSILTNHFNLSEKEAFRVLNEHGSTQKALTAVFAPLSDQTRVVKLKELTAKVAKVYQAVEYESSLQPYLPSRSDNRQPPPIAAVRPDIPPPTVSGDTGLPPTGPPPAPTTGSTAPRPPAGSTGGGGVGAPSTTATTASGGGSPRTAGPLTPTQKYSSYMNRNYPSPTSRAFSRLRLLLRGFGGVIFGNEVTDSGLPAVKTLNYEIDPSSAVGSILIVFQDDTRASFPNVSPEDAFAAYKIVFSGMGEIAALAPGEGVGLVGVDNPVRLTHCNKTPLEIREGRSFNVVMHPALADSDLGWSALMVDVLPIELKNLLITVEKNAGVDTRIAVDQLFETMLSSKFLGTWKVVDVPVTIRLENGTLSTMRTEDPGRNHPAGLRQTAFIEMHSLTRSATVPSASLGEYSLLSAYDEEFANSFYRMVPILANASYDYRRLNTFASVLALFRWAKQKGATGNLVMSTSKRVTTPGAITLFESSIESAADSSSALKNAIDKADECLRQAQSSPSVKEYSAREIQIQKLEDQYYGLLVSMKAKPPKGPVARKRGEAKLKSLEAQLDEAEKSNKAPEEVVLFKRLRNQRNLMKQQLNYPSLSPE